MDGKSTLRALCLGALLLALPSMLLAAKDTREERVRKFRDSLGEQVVRDSGAPVPPGERAAVIERVALFAGGGVALLAGAHLLLSRIRARRRKRETLASYLTENLMTPSAVRDHLRRAAVSRIPLALWVDEHFIKFSTRAEEIEGRDDVCAVLPLSPAAGNDMLRTSSRVRVEYLYEKVPYRFEAGWRGEHTEGGTFLHLLELPSRIQFTQRREFYRIEPPLADPVTCTLPPGGKVADMAVLDIGMGGFSAGTSARIRAGEAIETCKIGGGRLLPLEVSAKCVYELPLTEGKSRFRYRFGFQFTRLAEGSAKRLGHFISKQQVADLSRRKAMEQ